MLFVTFLLLASGLGLAQRQPQPAASLTRVPISIARHTPGAPVTVGIPLPKDAVTSPDQIRVMTPAGRRVPAQITEVSTWAPASPSLKWVWVFFFAEQPDRYVLEYGRSVRHEMPARRIEFVNNARDAGLAEITTGPLRFVARQGAGGFLYSVHLDLDGNGFTDDDLIASGTQARGGFADLLDDAGVDASQAFVRRTFIEKGSGPMHAILRVEGEYRYQRPDNNAAPFVTRIHAYAGQTYIRVLHTIVYTGVPDKHRVQPGDYPHVATAPAPLIGNDPTDKGWTVPNDRIHALGLGLSARLDKDAEVRASVRAGTWWQPGAAETITASASRGVFTLAQTGPKPDRLPPVPQSSPTARLTGFDATVTAGDLLARAETSGGWIDVTDSRRGIAVGLRHMLEEYPKALSFDPAAGELRAFTWSPAGGPMSFARFSNDPANENATENWAQGIAKTSELLFYFHGAGTPLADIERTMRFVHAPPVPHADAAWYGSTGAYDGLGARGTRFADLERALDSKFDWMLFNQRWEPWYGMFDHGDLMNTFNGKDWDTWGNGEPAQDFQWWLQFMRTGDPKVFDAAQAYSRHLMDVDNTHWPAEPKYLGDSNYPMDFWNYLKEPPGAKYLGVGRRHSAQHWSHILSAHVWVQGWVASYYLTADHRALDIARLSSDLYLKRIWGDHDLTGRRLYLSVWNLVEIWDATKDEKYKKELDDRVARMLRLQDDQAGSLVNDRYGYTNIYASHALWRYLAMTGDAAVRAALVRHARFVRDNPPLNHWMESYLSSIHSLVAGYRLTGESSFVDEMKRRLDVLKVEPLPRPIDDTWTQAELFGALEKAGHLPPDPNRFRPAATNRSTAIPEERRAIWALTNGTRAFGWTTAFTVPYAIALLEELQRR